MESNKKRKRALKETSEDRDRYYKKLRREQKKRYRQRKKGCQPQQAIVQEVSAINKASANEHEKRATEAPRTERHKDVRALMRGKRMVSAAVKKATQKVSNVPKPEHVAASCNANSLREIKAGNLKRDGAKSIGSGTFGACFLARYRNLRVVLKKFKHREGVTLEKLRREAAYEARVIQRLGDHPGIPLLFGVMLQQRKVGIIMQFHGNEDGQSLTIYKAAKHGIVKEEEAWNAVFCNVADALHHVHDCGFIHNDLKTNNVVLETRDGIPSPVIVDFGKSVLAEKAKKPVPKPEHLRKQLENGYIAPELVDGSSKPCVETDVYSLAYLVKSVCKLVPLSVNSTVKSALSKRPENRPSLIILKESF